MVIISLRLLCYKLSYWTLLPRFHYKTLSEGDIYSYPAAIIIRSNYRPQSRGDVYYEEINSNVKALYLKYKDIYIFRKKGPIAESVAEQAQQLC